jgi:hypothetical protein
LGKRRKSDGAKSGEYGTWGTNAILFLAKNSAQCKPYVVVRCHGGVPSRWCAISLDVFTSYPPSNDLEHRDRNLYWLPDEEGRTHCE